MVPKSFGKSRSSSSYRVDRKFKLFKLVFYQDNVTPADFVIDVIQQVFHKSPSEAYALFDCMYRQEQVTVGYFPKDIALAYMDDIYLLSYQYNYPFKCATVDVVK